MEQNKIASWDRYIENFRGTEEERVQAVKDSEIAKLEILEEGSRKRQKAEEKMLNRYEEIERERVRLSREAIEKITAANVALMETQQALQMQTLQNELMGYSPVHQDTVRKN